MARARTRETWDGGYIHTQADGRRLYIIEKRIGGKKLHVSTRAHIESAAYAQLRLFEADPFDYVARVKGGSAPEAASVLPLTPELALEYRAWLLGRERPATRRHANEMYHRLMEWIEDLDGADLRRLDLPALRTALEKRTTSRQHRIIAIKSFFSWARQHRAQPLIDHRNDPTLDLLVPQGSPEKHRRRKAVPFKHVQRVLRKLDADARDCLLVLANTGWHVSELTRFARKQGSIAPGQGEVLGVLQVKHKIGHTTRTPVTSRAVLAAAKRILKREQMLSRLRQKVNAACVKARVPVFNPGVMRHSVATWAIEAGTSPDVVAEFLGHKSKSTTLKWYADVGVPTAVVKLPKP